MLIESDSGRRFQFELGSCYFSWPSQVIFSTCEALILVVAVVEATGEFEG